MNVGEAVKERILELCRERDISINKLCTMSGVTQSTVNNIVSGRNHSVTISTIKSSVTAWICRLKSSFTLNSSAAWNKKSNRRRNHGLIGSCKRELTVARIRLF